MGSPTEQPYIVLISPFNGGELRLSPDTHPDMIEALIVAGFHRPIAHPPPPEAPRKAKSS